MPLTELHVSVNFNFMADAVALDAEDLRGLLPRQADFSSGTVSCGR
jgi:hypothetical protein